MTQEEATKLFEAELQTLGELFLKKNADYGNSFFESPFLVPDGDTLTGGMYRLSDKFARLRNLNAGASDTVGESRIDTLRDIANYSILLILAIENERSAQKNTVVKG